MCFHHVVHPLEEQIFSPVKVALLIKQNHLTNDCKLTPVNPGSMPWCTFTAGVSANAKVYLRISDSSANLTAAVTAWLHIMPWCESSKQDQISQLGLQSWRVHSGCAERYRYRSRRDEVNRRAQTLSLTHYVSARWGANSSLLSNIRSPSVVSLPHVRSKVAIFLSTPPRERFDSGRVTAAVSPRKIFDWAADSNTNTVITVPVKGPDRLLGGAFVEQEALKVFFVRQQQQKSVMQQCCAPHRAWYFLFFYYLAFGELRVQQIFIWKGKSIHMNTIRNIIRLPNHYR